MKIIGCVVLYNPCIENIENIIQYIPLLDHLYVMDNSDKINEAIHEKLKGFQSVTIIDMGGNRGIGQALRQGLDYAISEKADFCLTMDQDSIFSVDKWSTIKSYLERTDIDDYGIIGLNINSDSTDAGLVHVNLLPTSGNFINIKNYLKTNGFRTDLFIDSVDYELNHQFYKIGKKLAYINEVSLGHTVGTPLYRKFFFKKVTVSNHSPIRCYYRFRNNYLLYREDKKFYRECRWMDRKRLIQILLYEKQKKKKIKMILLGIKHAKQKKLGPLNQEDIQ